MQCIHCNEPLKPHWKNCPCCGEALLSACNVCGAALPPHARSCHICDAVLETECGTCHALLKPQWVACPECGQATDVARAPVQDHQQHVCAGSGKPLTDATPAFRCEACMQYFAEEYRYTNTSMCEVCAHSQGLDEFPISSVLETAEEPITPRLVAEQGYPRQQEVEVFEPRPPVLVQAGKVFRDPLGDGSDGPEMVTLPQGSFRMGDLDGNGDPSERPVHEVTITRSFAIGRNPVTFEEYDHFAAITGRVEPGDGGWGRGKRPVIIVSWECAQDYVRWLNEETGQNYRLPSEAEWEYAARAGMETAFPWGDDINAEQANFLGPDGPSKTTPVGRYPANPFGLNDMHGNVWEWVEDVWHESYGGAPTDGSPWVSGGDPRIKVLRGGSWYTFGGRLRSSSRNWFNATGRNVSFGFRLARDL